MYQVFPLWKKSWKSHPCKDMPLSIFSSKTGEEEGFLRMLNRRDSDGQKKLLQKYELIDMFMT